MKRPLALFALPLALLLPTVAAATVHIVETPGELILAGDFGGLGRWDLATVDRATGFVSVADADAVGALVWRPRALSSGLEAVTGATVGRFFPAGMGDFEALALTTPFANRVQILDLRAGAGGVPRSVPVNTLWGPSKLAPLMWADGTAPATVATAGVWGNTGGAFNLGHLGWQGTGWGQFLPLASRAGVPEHLFLLPDKFDERNVIGVLSRVPGDQRELRLFDMGGPIFGELATQPAPFADHLDMRAFASGAEDWLVRFDPENVVGGFEAFPWTNSTLQAPQVVPLGSQVVGLAFHPAPDRIFISGTLADGTALRVWEWVPGQAPAFAFNLPPAQMGTFLGLLPMGPGQVRVLRADVKGGPLAHVDVWELAGGTWKAGGGQAVPPVTRGASGANVLVFSADPFRDPEARLLRRVTVGDWTEAFTRTPAKFLVHSARWLGAAAGMGDAQSVELEMPASETDEVLINQLRPYGSFFTGALPLGDTPRSVRVEPAGGLYDATVMMEFVYSQPAISTVLYRREGDTGWTAFSPGQPVPVFTDATFHYMLFTVGGPASPIGTVRYTFSVPPEAMDSDFDGVPDFVKIAFGLDPRGGPDSDLDGVSDLIEMLMGTDPGNPLDFPEALAPLGIGRGGAFRIELEPFSETPVALHVQRDPVPVSPDTGVAIYTMEGARLAAADTVVRPFGRVGAVFPDVPAAARDLFLVAATDAVFAPSSQEHPEKQPFGRQLLALVPAVETSAGGFDGPAFGHAGGLAHLQAEAQAWLDAFAQWNAEQAPVEGGVLILDTASTLHALLVEYALGALAFFYGQHQGPFSDPAAASALVPPEGGGSDSAPVFSDPLAGFPHSHITLTAFRPSELAVSAEAFAEAVAGAEEGDIVPSLILSSGQLRSMRFARSALRPALLPPYDRVIPLEEVRGGAAFAGLRALTVALYRVSASDETGTLLPPVDALRHFLRFGELPTEAWEEAFDDAGGTPLLSAAASEMSALGGFIQARVVDEMDLVHIGEGEGSTPFRRVAGFYPGMTLEDFLEWGAAGAPRVYLLGPDGEPYRASNALALGEGTFLRVRGYRDLWDFDENYIVLEVIGQPLVQALPKVALEVEGLVSPDLLELYGVAFLDPFADDDGDGYSNLQEILAGSDPFSAGSIPRTPGGAPQTPLDVGLPELRIAQDEWGYHYELHFDFPPELSQDIRFVLYASEDLQDFQPTGDTAHWTGMGTRHSVALPSASGMPGGGEPAGFYRLRMRLR